MVCTSIPVLADLLFPAAARILVANLPVDGPVDVFISRLILEREVRAIVAVPALVWQADAYNKGDIVHTNVYKPPTKPAPMLAQAPPKYPPRPPGPTPMIHQPSVLSLRR